MSGNAIVRSTAALTLSNLAIRCASMLFQVWLSGRLGAAGLGLMQLISAVGVLAFTLGCGGVRTAALYLTAEELGLGRPGGVRGAVRWCLGYGLAVSSAAGAALFFLAPRLARVWIADGRAVAGLRVLALSLPPNCLCAVLTGCFTALGKLRPLIRIELGERAASVVLTAALLRGWAGDDLGRACCAVFLGGAATCALSCGVLYAILRRDPALREPVPPDLGMSRRLLRLCGPLALNECLRSGLSTLENLLIPQGLRRNGSSGTGALETYGVIHGMVFPVVTFASVLLFSLADVLVPELARCRAAGDGPRIRRLTGKALRAGLVFAAAAAGLLFCLAEPLGRLLYRSDAAGQYIRFFAPLVPMLYLDAIVDGMQKGLGQQLATVRYNTLTSALDTALLFFLLPRFGIRGYLLSFTVTHLLNFYLSLGRLIHVTGHPLALGFAVRVPLLASLAAAAVRLLVRLRPAEGLLSLLPGGIYLGLLFLLLLCTGDTGPSSLRWVRALLPQRARP